MGPHQKIELSAMLREIDQLVQTILDEVRVQEDSSAEAVKKEPHGQNTMF